MLPPVEKVKNQWDSTQHGVELRQQQLEDMVIDSLQWDDHREETEELMRKYEARLYILCLLYTSDAADEERLV